MPSLFYFQVCQNTGMNPQHLMKFIQLEKRSSLTLRWLSDSCISVISARPSNGFGLLERLIHVAQGSYCGDVSLWVILNGRVWFWDVGASPVNWQVGITSSSSLSLCCRVCLTRWIDEGIMESKMCKYSRKKGLLLQGSSSCAMLL